MQDPTGVGPTADEQKQLVTRILASELFKKSHRLSSFLKFICDQYSLGNAACINEQKIGTEVFGRPVGYHVGEDSIVRSQARFLRQRLEEYFVAEGSQERFILLIPKGSYVPAFERRELVSAPTAPVLPTTISVAQPVSPDIGVDHLSDRRRGSGSRPLLIVGAVCALVLAVGLGYFLRKLQDPQRQSESPLVRSFWLSLFSPERTVVLVPADSTLVMMEEMTGKPVRLLSYVNKDYLKTPSPAPSTLWNMLIHSQYTNVADLNLVAHLSRVPEAVNSRMQIRYAHDLSLKELKDGNAILIGGLRANPWVELFASTVNFDVDFDWETRHNVVRNRTPGSKEQSLYIEDTSGDAEDSRAYGVVVYIPSLDGQGHTLLVEGTSKAGTEAAGEFLTSPAFDRFLQQIGASGDAIPNFELLLSTSSMNGASYHPAVVCWHPLGKNLSSQSPLTLNK